MMSALGFSLMGVFVKITAAQGIPVLEMVAARALISVILSYIDIRRKNISALGVRRGLLFARGFVGALALICVYYSLSHLPFAAATVLQYLHPMFTGFLAFLFLKERLSQATFICVILSFLGLIIIVQPAFIFGGTTEHYPLIAILAAIAGAFGSAIAYVLVRKLSQTEDPSVIIFYFPLIALPISVLLLADNVVMPQGWQWLLLLCIGIFTQVGQVGLTKAMQTETAGKATSFSYLQVVFAIIFGMVLFAEVPTLPVIFGSVLIIMGAFINIRVNK